MHRISFNTPIIKINQSFNSNNIYIKRDDLIPFSFGGNKVRIASEYFMDLFKKKCNCIISYGSSKSNLNRVIANFSKLYSMPCSIVYSDNINYINNNTFNSIIIKNFEVDTFCSFNQNLPDIIQGIIDTYRSKGLTPYYIYGNKLGLGNEIISSSAYKKAYLEILNYEKRHKRSFDYIFLPSGTGATQSGLIIGSLINNDHKKIIGISVARDEINGKESLHRYIDSHKLKFSKTQIKDKVIFIDKFNCSGYAKFNDIIIDTIKNTMNNCGIALDSTYTGKAFWGMKQYILDNNIRNSNILFLHTGGLPLFFDDINLNKLYENSI